MYAFILLQQRKRTAVSAGRIARIYTSVLLLFALLTMPFLQLFGASPTAPTQLNLLPATMPFIPKEYYIAGVLDEREDRSRIGNLISLSYRPGQAVVTQAADLNGGAQAAISAFIRQSMQPDKSLRPVVVRIKECVITETPASAERVNGRVMLTLAFDLQGEDKLVPLLEYSRGGAHYNRPAYSYKAVEKALQQSLVSALRYLNSWMEEQADSSILLAKEVKISFSDFSSNTDRDTVFYSPDRPLTWNDFRERPRLERFAASVFPNFAYESHSKVVDGVLQIDILLKVYMLPQYSWVKDHARDAYSLNHEQRHFDIAKLVAERFKQKVRTSEMLAEDYESFLHWQYLDSYREMNQLQQQYDGETGHGTNQAAQQRWNKRIDDELRSFSLK